MGLFSRKKSLPAIETAPVADAEKVEPVNDEPVYEKEPQTPGMESNFNVSTTSFATYDEKLSYDAGNRPQISNTDALDIMGDHLYRYGCNWKKWFQPVDEESYYFDSDQVATGICLRSDTGKQRSYPLDCAGMDEFEWAVTSLNPAVAFKIRSPIVLSIMASYIQPDTTEFTINADTRIQILDELSHLGRARKHQYAAFVRDEGVLCVWSDSVKTIVADVEKLEKALLDFVWNHEHTQQKMTLPTLPGFAHTANSEAPAADSGDAEDIEVSEQKKQWKSRPVIMYDSIIAGFNSILICALVALGYRTLIKGYLLDGKPARFALITVTPFIIPLMMFSTQTVVSSLWQIFGPVNQVARNSLTYSAIAPKRTLGELPHVTVWLPVYKEDLEDVIMPTVESLKVAQATYERQGGSVSILVCDDGLQLISPEEVDARKRFYHNNNMAYVSRPGHGVNGFQRRGRFKKASNMNFAIQLSLRIEEILDEMRPHAQDAMGEDYFWSDEDEQSLYEAALSQGVAETEGLAWADGNIRIGAVILIIDSDTRVPEDCLVDAVSEFEQCPDVAIIQHSSGVMQVAHHFFENGIAHFTRSIQLAISFCCANGAMGPFVGHNAFLRWSALQEIIFEEDGVRKVWSESHVSEDFAISLALQLKGYIVRWVTYSDDKFEEGVSLTCDDEVNRWQKYAWGCSELLFHPFRYWVTRGPFTPLFRQYLGSNIPLSGKISTLGYIFSYYAIGLAWPLTVLNYVLIGFAIPVDAFYLNGWKVVFTCLILFPGLGNLSAVVLRYRLKVAGTGAFAKKQLTYILFFSVFFSGLSLQILSALICHMIGYQMTWAATLKTVEASNFFKEVPDIMRKFKFTLPLNILMVVGMILTTSSLMPLDWRVGSIEAIIPMAMTVGSHILYPIVLNPWLVHFTF